VKQIRLKDKIIKVSCCNECPACYDTDMGDNACGFGFDGYISSIKKGILPTCELEDWGEQSETIWLNDHDSPTGCSKMIVKKE
jgi:hypothetical protein